MQRVQPRLFDVVEVAAGLVAALPEQPITSIASSSIPELLVGRRPALTDDVLVQVLPGAEAEEEPAFHHRRGGRWRRGR